MQPKMRLDQATEKPVLLKARVNGTVVTFKLLVTELKLANEDNVQAVGWLDPSKSPVYFPGRSVTRVSLQGVLVADDTFTEADLEDFGEFESLLGKRKLQID